MVDGNHSVLNRIHLCCCEKSLDGWLWKHLLTPFWMEQVLWARSGYNATVAADSGVFADRPTYVAPSACVNLFEVSCAFQVGPSTGAASGRSEF